MAVGQSGEDIAIIPARGGSKRIPRKNIIDFEGKPMIAWTIEAAINSCKFSRVFVNTDDEEIAEISSTSGAEVPFLRTKHSDDYSPVSAATLSYALQLANSSQISSVTQLMANCPLRSAKTIDILFEEFKAHPDGLSLISAMPYGMFNPWWAHEVGENQFVKPLFEEALNGQRSQDLPRLLCPTGSMWSSTFDNLKQSGTFYSKNYRLFDIGWKEGIDIDDYEDLEMAKATFQLSSFRS